MIKFELEPYGSLAVGIFKRILADIEESELRRWIQAELVRIEGLPKDGGLMTWEESFDFTDNMIEEYEIIKKWVNKDAEGELA